MLKQTKKWDELGVNVSQVNIINKILKEGTDEKELLNLLIIFYNKGLEKSKETKQYCGGE